MLKKTITYTNPFTEQEVSEEHYFHMSKAGLIELDMASLHEPEVTDPETGAKLNGFRARLQRIINDRNGEEIMSIVKDMIRRSYGKKEGDRFLRSPEIWADFESSEAFSQLYFDLCTNANAQADFMNGVIPSSLEREMTKVGPQTEVDKIKARIQGEEAATGITRPTASPESFGIRDVDNSDSDPTGLTTETTPRVLTRAEVVEMDSEELKSGLAAGRYKLS